MASRDEMMKTILRAYEARGKSDMDGLMDAFHPNARFEIKGDRNLLEVAGAVEGGPNVRKALAGLTQAFEFLEREIVNAVIEGDRAAVHSRVKIRFVPKDITLTTDVLDTMRFENGKIVQFEEFADTALIKSLVTG
jgi:ketosteroid isomerase-like protein